MLQFEDQEDSSLNDNLNESYGNQVSDSAELLQKSLRIALEELKEKESRK